MKKLTKIIITVLVLLMAACAMGIVVLSNASFFKINETTLKKAQNTDEGIVVTWEPMTLIHKYAVYRKVGNEEKWTHLTTVKDENFYTDKAVQSGKVCTYTVRPYVTKYINLKSTEPVSVLCLSVPKITSICNTDKGIAIKWNTVIGAKGYEIYRRQSGVSGWTRAATFNNGKSSHFTDYSIKNNETYAYRVIAFGPNSRSGFEKSGAVYRFISAPVLSGISGGACGITVSWEKGADATRYFIYRKDSSSGKWDGIATVKGDVTKYCDESAVSGRTYTYTVRQAVGKYCSSFDGKGLSKLLLAAPKSVKAVNSPNGVTIKWTRVAGSTGYIIYRRVIGLCGWRQLKYINNPDTNSYIDKYARYSKVNNYIMRACYTDKFSDTTQQEASVRAVNPNKAMVALTYDDGPYTPVTNHILDVLEKYNSRATFFVVGSRLNDYSDCVKREVALGCEIGNHTYNHTTLTAISDSEIKDELSKTNSLLNSLTGAQTSIVRAPGGEVSKRVKAAVGYPMFNWSVDTRDWSHRNCEKTVENIKNNVGDGSIVLMHDLYTSSGDATELIVPWLIKQGYQLVTVSEMMQTKGIDLENGHLYYSAA